MSYEAEPCPRPSTPAPSLAASFTFHLSCPIVNGVRARHVSWYLTHAHAPPPPARSARARCADRRTHPHTQAKSQQAKKVSVKENTIHAPYTNRVEHVQK